MYGHGQEKELTELVPGILNQLGPDSLASLRKMAEQYSANAGRGGFGAGAGGAGKEKEADDDNGDDDVPVSSFSSAAAETTRHKGILQAKMMQPSLGHILCEEGGASRRTINLSIAPRPSALVTMSRHCDALTLRNHLSVNTLPLQNSHRTLSSPSMLLTRQKWTNPQRPQRTASLKR